MAVSSPLKSGEPHQETISRHTKIYLLGIDILTMGRFGEIVSKLVLSLVFSLLSVYATAGDREPLKCCDMRSPDPFPAVHKLNSTVEKTTKVFVTNQCSSGEKFELIQELMDLPAGASVPDWILEKYDSKTIARNLIHRKEVVSASKNHPQKTAYYDFCRDTSIRMVFPDRVIEGIVSKGFLNSHGIHGKTNHTMEGAENDMMGVSLPSTGNMVTKAHKVLPKYAYLTLMKEEPRMWKARLDRRYGNMVAVFKDQIKDRTTFSPGNSWVIRGDIKSLSYKTDVPFPEPDYEHTRGEHREWGHHWEAQIWGELSINDVEYFMVNCPYFGTSSPDRINALKKTGIPIYQCDNDPDNSKVIRGKRLF